MSCLCMATHETVLCRKIRYVRESCGDVYSRQHRIGGSMCGLYTQFPMHACGNAGKQLCSHDMHRHCRLPELCDDCCVMGQEAQDAEVIMAAQQSAICDAAVQT